MPMLPETRAALARYDEWAARASSPTDQRIHPVATVDHPGAKQLSGPRRRSIGRRMERTARTAARRVRNMVLGVMAVMLGAFLFGLFVAPLGFAGIMVTILAAVCVMVFLSGWPAEPEASLETLPQTPVAALPAQVDRWLESKRALLPPPAARDVDSIMAQLDRLAPELAKIDAKSAMADEARTLVADHLPRLVSTYIDVPATHRATPEATARLREGLRVVGSEIERMTTTIARESLDRLEVEGKFLQSRYDADRRIDHG